MLKTLLVEPLVRQLTARHPFTLVDGGAAGAADAPWRELAAHVRAVGFEPDERSLAALRARAAGDPRRTYLGAALGRSPGEAAFHLTRVRTKSSLLRPNAALLAEFPDAARFDVVGAARVRIDTLARQLKAAGIADPDFLKLDVQGGELAALEGASPLLHSSLVGVQVEVEFIPIYEGQPLFGAVDAYLRGFGFALFDLRPYFWKRAAGVGAGGPRGQLVYADALYFKEAVALGRAASQIADPAARAAKAVKALAATDAYGYADYALHLLRGDLGRALAPADARALEAALRAAPAGGALRFPGSARVGRALHRFARRLSPQDPRAWRTWGRPLGNRGD